MQSESLLESTPSLTEHKSFCRLCNSHCGMVVSTDAEGRLVAIRPDREDLLTEGFACFKGLQAPDAHNSEIRIRHPLKRMTDGSFVEIGLEQALDEIADKLKEIVARHGPEAVGAYRGSGAGMNASACFLVDSVLHPLGTKKIFSAITIDQSAKIIAAERMGVWPAGPYPFRTCDVLLLIGTNPLVSFAANLNSHHPLKHLRKEKERGLKLLMIDPRKTETGRFAEMELQPLPGEDASILAGMIRLILENGWEDRDFVSRHAAQVEELRASVEPFAPDYVARRADIDEAEFIELTRVFAQAERGVARSGTGANMGRHSNLIEHLVGALNVICGNFMREGEEIANPGVLLPRQSRPAQVTPPTRSWESGYKSRIEGYGMIVGELPTGVMADEILQPGPGQIKAFFCHGGNAAVIVPDQAKVVEAFQQLELLVTIDPFWNPTAELSHYVLPTVMQYERPDLPCWQAEFAFYEYVPFTRYTPAVATPPKEFKVATDDYIFWGLAKRLGVQMQYLGHDIDMSKPPETEDFLRIAALHAPIDFDELKRHELGLVVNVEPQQVEPGDPGSENRFALCPPDVAGEIALVLEDVPHDEIVMANGATATHRFCVRRHRDIWNSTQVGLKNTRKRLPHNVACINPGDLARLGVESGELIRLTSAIAAVDVVAEADETVRPGVVTMVHGFGVLPDKTDPRRHGASANLLISTRSEDRESINAMPRMTAFPVHIGKADRLNATATVADGRILEH
jgi:anaerobic selenocysteine-containing dehydrogenase